MARITYADKVALNVNPEIADINKVKDTDLNQIKQVVNDNETKILLAVSDTAPAECSTGDVYYNTTTNLLYTATGTNTWGSTGVAPTENTIYILFDSQTAYAYDGITLVSVGGGSDVSDLIVVGTDTPTENTKLQIESNDLDPQGTYITNTESQSTTLGYSAAYTNARNTYSTSETFTGKYWIDGKPIYRKVIEITDTNASASNWKEYTYTTLGLPSTIELCMFPEAYTQITQANKLYTESFYSNGSRVQTAPADSKVNILGNGATYSKYIIIAEYTKTTD